MSLKQPRRMQKEEKLYIGEEDRNYLESLPETVRERILYERHLKKTEENERRELKHRNNLFTEEDETESDSSKDTKRKKEKTAPAVPSKATTYDVFKAVVLRRSTFVSNVYKKALKSFEGYYVKIRLLEGYHVYRITKIYEGKRYEIEGKVTNQWMCLERAGDRRQVNIQSISNRGISKEEYTKYIEENAIAGGNKTLQKMQVRLSKCLEKRMSEEEQDYSLGQMRRFSKDRRITAKRRLVLKVTLERAKNEGNLKEIEDLEREIQELSEPSEMYGA
ncbi:uncharacterized protein NESG_00964 [Nematocida ausubeli]|uniref:Plus3 domain-containing protein n=1 Tax=Nematocida ausubeli (strain ATCC PRA-371 / ERTm2) TaxID=1913371 RepID=A0A086J3U0_NEMA1|nr:uncharacterized protein NESG_00964 [Nematocida ausubeli]KFG26808.1 hypothetical protein NESG_00964 [Nematocida ausubeli]